LRLAWTICLSLYLALGAGALQAIPVRTEHVTAELVAERSAVQPGQSVRIGLRLQHIPHWHTYWRNPGDSGLPTRIDWIHAAGGQAVIAHRGEWVRYSSPGPDGADYVAVCVPAFAPDTVHREE